MRLALLLFSATVFAQNSPTIASVANAAGGQATIAPNTWVTIFGQNLARANDSRTWQTSDFVNSQMPTAARRRQRDRQRQERLSLLHQPHTGEYSDSAQRDAGIGDGTGDVQRRCQRGVFRAGAARIAFVFHVSAADPMSRRNMPTTACLARAVSTPVSQRPRSPGKPWSFMPTASGRLRRQWSAGHQAIGNSVASAGGHHWRASGEGAVCGTDRLRESFSSTCRFRPTLPAVTIRWLLPTTASKPRRWR